MKYLIAILALMLLAGCGIKSGQVNPASVCDVRRSACALQMSVCEAFGQSNKDFCVKTSKFCTDTEAFCGTSTPAL